MPVDRGGAGCRLPLQASGDSGLPGILTTLRQQAERERKASLMCREERAARGLALNRTDGAARLIAGDDRQVLEAPAALWAAQRAANAADPPRR